jgi:tetratricopeptide (TPR) repeat protein
MSGSSRLSQIVKFGDLSGSEANLRAELGRTEGAERLQVETQLARVMGLNGGYEGALQLLARIRTELEPGDDSLAGVRTDLEEGRCHRDQNRPDQAIACFKLAFDAARRLNDAYLMFDAAHMIAITGEPTQQIHAGEQALALLAGVSDEDAMYWRGPILNNLGWSYLDDGQLERALELFQQSVEYRREGPKRPFLIARYTVARTLRALGKHEEALALLPALQAENVELGGESPYVNEEIGECLVALGRQQEARPYCAKAFAALSQDTCIATNEPDRLSRLKTLSGSIETN